MPRLERAERAVDAAGPLGEQGDDPPGPEPAERLDQALLPMPSRSIGKPPIDRMREPSAGTNRLERAT